MKKTTDNQTTSPLDVAILDSKEESKKDSGQLVKKDRKPALFSDESDSSDGELFSKLKKTDVKPVQNNRPIPNNVQTNCSLFGDSDDDEDIFTSLTERPEVAAQSKQQISSDPLLNLPE